MVEVFISGAGPAGAIAALVLARAGVRVLVADRAVFPRGKLCGDTLNPGAMEELRRLGLDGPVAALGVPLSGMRVTGEGVDLATDYPVGVSGRAISRRDLDSLLLDAAVAAGAQVQQGFRVVGPLADERLGGLAVRGAVVEARRQRVRVPAAVTIAADGRRSPLALATGLLHHPAWPRRWAVGAYFSGVDGLTTRGEMHVRRGHYVGVAPLPGGLANACLVRAASREMRDPDALLRRTLADDPELGPRFASAVQESPALSLGPLAVDAQAAGCPGLLLAGDAAGFVDPMTGDGLRLALRGGVLAAEVAMQMLEKPYLPGYVRLAERRRRAFGTKLRVNRVLRRLVDSPSGLRAAAVGARFVPAMLARLVAFAGDVPGNDALPAATREAAS